MKSSPTNFQSLDGVCYIPSKHIYVSENREPSWFRNKTWVYFYHPWHPHGIECVLTQCSVCAPKDVKRQNETLRAGLPPVMPSHNWKCSREV